MIQTETETDRQTDRVQDDAQQTSITHLNNILLKQVFAFNK